ncbi:MAG: hypothetical protein FWG39_01665 [Alphaproteobacteria bacterium]|nr:hypothetical protein [Alphaproteobacteria bacterium]
MKYLWEKFNIKTFPARPAVFVDGVFDSELSDMENTKIQTSGDTVEITVLKPDDLPVHIIYVGEIAGDKKIIIRNPVRGALYFSVKLKNKSPAFLRFFIENAGKYSETRGDIVIQNESDLTLNITADHLAENTGIFVKTRVLAHGGSATDLYAAANVLADCRNCESDIGLSAMCAPDIKSIKMSPNQKIASVPELAEHSASIYKGTKPQIEFLAIAGLSLGQIKQTLQDAFLN